MRWAAGYPTLLVADGHRLSAIDADQGQPDRCDGLSPGDAPSQEEQCSEALPLLDPSPWLSLESRGTRDLRVRGKTMQRNLTLSLDEDLIQKARVLAARRRRSVSALLREELTRLVAEDDAYEAAKRVALSRLEQGGSHLGGGPLPTRDELHDRARLR
jgi:plasmid stability protein